MLVAKHSGGLLKLGDAATGPSQVAAAGARHGTMHLQHRLRLQAIVADEGHSWSCCSGPAGVFSSLKGCLAVCRLPLVEGRREQ